MVWSHSSGHCTLSSSGTNSTSLLTVARSDIVSIQCPFAQSEMFSVYPDAASASADTFYITFTDAPCYRWYLHVPASAQLASADFQALVWILDPLNAAANELDSTATAPSAASIQLSRGFASLGQSPALHSDEAISFLHASSAEFDSTLG